VEAPAALQQSVDYKLAVGVQIAMDRSLIIIGVTIYGEIV
jgi:hypothetical protein